MEIAHILDLLRHFPRDATVGFLNVYVHRASGVLWWRLDGDARNGWPVEVQFTDMSRAHVRVSVGGRAMEDFEKDFPPP